MWLSCLDGAQTKFASQQIYPAKKEIYRKGWIDFNKNGKKDVYEDPVQPIDLRIKDLLSQMTLEEKTCQLATLYGYKRVLKDDLPTPEWKEVVWKDGIANIDEHLNGLKKTPYSYPYSLHAETINEVQRWFVEQTRLGIPVDFSNEGIHGLNHDRSTPLPAPISIGSTWDKALVREAGDIVGREAKALGYTNVYAPILDVARDQRKTSVYGALYPFGFGLSYTTFEYANLKVSPEKGHPQSDIHVSVDVKNTGSRAGDEVVQLYVKDLYSSVTTYVSKLRSFERIHLEPGETKTVQFVLKPSDLELLDKNMQWTVEPGDFQVCIGSSSEDIRLEKGFRLD